MRRAAYWLRRIADRIDHHGAPKLIGWWFTFEEGRGIVFRDDGRGCRLAYLGDEQYELAHDQAGPVRLAARRPQRLVHPSKTTGPVPYWEDI
jgi:hypothetical protein